MTIDQTMQAARKLCQESQWTHAEAIYRQVISEQPNLDQAYNELGITLREQRRWEEAIAAISRAIQLNPSFAEAHYNLGNVLRDMKQLPESAAAYRRAIQLRPNLSEAHNNLGNALFGLKDYSQAEAAYRRSFQLTPNSAMACNNLGNVMRETGRLVQALAAFERAIALKPDYAIAISNRGVILKELGRPDEAADAFRQAIARRPDNAEALDNLAGVLKGQGRLQELISVCNWVLGRSPRSAAAYSHLADAHWRLDRLDDALAFAAKAMEIAPDLAEAHNTLGNIQRDRGDLDSALACFRKAVALNPTAAGFHGNLAYTVHFHPDYDSAKILEVNRQWAVAHEKPLSPAAPSHANDRSAGRKLRIGYVSPDFRGHCASFFLLPLLTHHDRRQVDVFCYSGVTQADAVTDAFKRLGHYWREVSHLSDASLVEQIRADQIDILVDLALHMAGGRLLVFARRPAPVQVTWLGYPSTTGLSSIDYRLTDPYLDPPGQGDEFYSERSIRLPDSFWCYHPSIPTADVSPLPAASASHVTFGCFNNFVKVTRATLDLWARVLAAVPNSRLLMLCPTGSHRDLLLKRFEDAGINADRIELVSRVPMDEYFRLYHRVDICLDTLPYPGHTTTLDSLWMGVPVVTLAGQTSVARGGVSILSNAGHPQWIAHSHEQYIEIVRGLASDLPALSEHRSALRAALHASPLMNPQSFAAGVERAYRGMWETWVARV